MSEYYPGASVVLAVNIEVAGVDKDPDAVTLKVKTPTGITETFTFALAQVLKDSIGNYHYDYPVTIVGIYHCRFETTSPAKGASESTFVVLESSFDS